MNNRLHKQEMARPVLGLGFTRKNHLMNKHYADNLNILPEIITLQRGKVHFGSQLWTYQSTAIWTVVRNKA